MITDEPIPMMPMFTPVARTIIESLLEKDPSRRLGSGPTGVEEIKTHAFFRDINWEMLQAKQVEVPFVPKTESIDDL